MATDGSPPIVQQRRDADLLTAVVAASHIDIVGRSSRAPYPTVRSIPRTSATRLALAATEDEYAAPIPASALPRTAARDAAGGPMSKLYLAYGSNLCAETFLGARGIRPISQVNVSAPSLRLTFDLPGMPYREPCFANTAPRKIPKPPTPPVPLPEPPIKPPPFDGPPFASSPTGGSSPPGRSSSAEPAHAGPQGGPVLPPGDPTWDGGLIGVVYEVTPEDYAHIIATEGGGSSYLDILVPCLALPPRLSVPERPPDIPRPFLAHTLCMPNLPDAPPEEPDDPANPDPRKKWWWRFVQRPHRQDGYAQPSARYLKLITDGAAEHDLPDDYQAYLHRLKPYMITTWRQKLALLVLLVVYGPMYLLMRYVGPRLDNDKGEAPSWWKIFMAVMFNTVWIAYDKVLHRLFGDGERTEEEKEDEDGSDRQQENEKWKGDGRTKSARELQKRLRLQFGTELTDEEKAPLLAT